MFDYLYCYLSAASENFQKFFPASLYIFLVNSKNFRFFWFWSHNLFLPNLNSFAEHYPLNFQWRKLFVLSIFFSFNIRPDKDPSRSQYPKVRNKKSFFYVQMPPKTGASHNPPDINEAFTITAKTNKSFPIVPLRHYVIQTKT